MDIEGPPDRVFPLLCPVREAQWLDGWVGRPIHAETGVAELGGVFATEHADQAEPTIWLITRHDRETHEIAFAYFVPGQQVVQLEIRAAARGVAGSTLHIEYMRTGISEAGNERLAGDASSGRFDDRMRHWKAAMNHYLATGELLKEQRKLLR
jgi:hypothetical protein